MRRLLLVLLLAGSSRALAHSDGYAVQGCGGCHGGGNAPTVTVTSTPAAPKPGDAVTLHVSISSVNGGASGTGGFYMLLSGATGLTPIGSYERYAFADDTTEIVHSKPEPETSNLINFDVGWTVPSGKGGVDIDVWAISSNNNNSNSGDGPGQGHLSLAWGCAGITYYKDFDGDGHGAASTGTTINCAVPPGYATSNDDCNDYNFDVHPGAPEVCDGLDNDCNGKIDDGLALQTYYLDGDGDGYGRAGGAGVSGCKPPSGYGVGNEDCDDTDPTVHPGAAEMCDGKDNDCNGKVDDGAKAICGVGLCVASGASCDVNTCVPGTPGVEVCNGLDDDCNGLVDDGPNLCPNGQTCSNGVCTGGSGGGGGGGGGAVADGGTGAPKTDVSGVCSAAGSSELALLAIAALVIQLSARKKRRSAKQGSASR